MRTVYRENWSDVNKCLIVVKSETELHTKMRIFLEIYQLLEGYFRVFFLVCTRARVSNVCFIGFINENITTKHTHTKAGKTNNWLLIVSLEVNSAPNDINH